MLPVNAPIAVSAADCRYAAMYLQMADHSIEESDSWSANSSDVADSLSTASMEVAEHFVDLAGRQFDGLECGSGIYMWWTGDHWQTFPAKYLFRDHSLLVSMLRDGKAELRHWQTQGWAHTHPNEFQGGVDGFHRLQMIAKIEGVDASGAPARRTSKAPAAKKHANVVAANSQKPAQGLTCARPNVPASTIRASEPDTPPLAAQQGISGTVQVLVSLDTDGKVTSARVQSSPSAILNDAAIAAAQRSQFTPEIRNCRPIAAGYIFSVEFSSQ